MFYYFKSIIYRNGIITCNNIPRVYTYYFVTCNCNIAFAFAKKIEVGMKRVRSILHYVIKSELTT